MINRKELSTPMDVQQSESRVLTRSICGAVLCVCVTLASCATAPSTSAEKKSADKPAEAKQEQEKSNGQKPGAPIDFPLRHNLDEKGVSTGANFKTGNTWVVSDFYGKGLVRVEGDTVILEKGNDMTGVAWRGPVCKNNFEVSLEAKRVGGSDFFCGLTVPFNDTHCSLVLGGWGGNVCGISSLDYEDAANNDTTSFHEFKMDTWYKVRLRVTPEKIEAWIDDEQIVDCTVGKRKVGYRWEVEPSFPFGISTWQTAGAIRNIELKAF
jgi:hypothetical protein